jgi:hypothetical protein
MYKRCPPISGIPVLGDAGGGVLLFAPGSLFFMAETNEATAMRNLALLTR